MSKKLISLMAIITLVMITAVPALPQAKSNIPETAINKILNYKNGLNLTDSQIKKLTIINRTIIDKMIQAKAQAQLRKTEIDEFTSNWTNMHSTAVNHIIKEYYQFLAELKTLELDAIVKARAILSREQLKRYVELASIESMIIKLDAELVGNY